jgi:hypothetical protein
MKKDLVLIAFQVWAAALALILVVSIGYTVWSVCTGNYSGTACREF